MDSLSVSTNADKNEEHVSKPGEEGARTAISAEELARWAQSNLLPVDMEHVERWVLDEERPRCADGTADSLRRLLIIQKDRGYWLADFVNGGYRGPYTAAEAPVELEQFVSTLPSWLYSRFAEAANGRERKKGFVEILTEISTRAKHVHLSLSAQTSHFNPLTCTMVEAATPRRTDIGGAAYDAQIAAYLDAYGSSQLIDWLASFGRLQKPTSALAIVGPASIGKGLLAAALASRYSATASPMDAEAVLGGNFNGGLGVTPIVFLDEGTSEKMSTKIFRKLLGNRTHTLKRKYLPEATLIGCPRLVIAVNDISELEFADKMNSASLEAVTLRFTIVQASDAPKKYLESLPAGTTERWIQTGQFARHLMWLEANHKYVEGRRFLVEGTSSKLHKTLTSANCLDTLQVLALLLASPNQAMIADGKLLIGEGKYLVNASALRAHYKAITGDAERLTPKLQHLVKDLENVGREERANNRHYFAVDVDLVADTAETLQIANADDLRARVNGPLVRKGAALKLVQP